MNIRFSFVAATVGLALVGFSAPEAQAQRPTLLDCLAVDVANPQISVCSNGQGATFAYPWIANIFGDNDLSIFPGTPATSNVRTNPTTNVELFGDQFNYGSRGSGAGLSGFSRAFCIAAGNRPDSFDPSADLNVPPVPEPAPCSFFLSERPISAARVDDPTTEVFSSSERSLVEVYGDLSNPTSPYSLGLGRPVQLPLVGGAVTVAYDDAGANLQQLTRAQWCGLFSGTPAAGTPALLAGAVGVHRSDSSGTTFVMTSALNDQCNPDTNRNGVRDGAEGPFLFGYTVGTQTFSRGAGQISLRETEARCTDTISNISQDIVCWPAAFLSSPGNDGVVDTVRLGLDRVAGGTGNNADAVARFGYVELAEANANNVNRASLENLSGNFVQPTSASASVSLDLAGTLDQENVTGDACVIEIPTSRPTAAQGYPIVGLAYGLFYQDYDPDVVPAGPLVFPNPDLPTGNSLPGSADSFFASAYSFGGPILAARYQLLASAVGVGNPSPYFTAVSNLGYVPLPSGLGGELALRAIFCIGATDGEAENP